MSRTPTPLKIRRRFPRGIVQANAYDSLSATNIAHLKQYSAQLSNTWLHASSEDAHWQWDKKVTYYKKNGASTWVLETKSASKVSTEGVIIFAPALSYLDKKTSIVEIKYLVTAPHNRPRLFGLLKGRHSGVGTTLMGIADAVSSQLGYGRKIGLFALPMAEAFYERLPGLMRHDRIRDSQGLVYFEGVLQI